MENTNSEIDALTNNPTEAWKKISETQKVHRFNVETPVNPVEPNKVRFVCMSDTHSTTNNINFNIPDGDVFIHAGDFTKFGLKDEVCEFNTWIGCLPHKHKIIIAGNHEISFDKKLKNKYKGNSGALSIGQKLVNVFKSVFFMRKTNIEDEEPPHSSKISEALHTPNIRSYLTNCTYLEDASIAIYGIQLYGTPWQPGFGHSAFNLKRGEECLFKWKLIPDNTDVLITHTPPLGHGDLVCSVVRTGCLDLLNTIQQRVHPKYHVFGHIHEGYGISSDGKTVFINASTCDETNEPNNPPIVFDMVLPAGYSKT